MPWPPPRPKPIRYDVDTWVVMRDDPVLPAAIISRQRAREGVEYFRAVTWDLDPAKRLLIGRYASLGAADDAVRYLPPDIPGAPRGRQAFGMYA